jgi:hypothetical protein
MTRPCRACDTKIDDDTTTPRLPPHPADQIRGEIGGAPSAPQQHSYER